MPSSADYIDRLTAEIQKRYPVPREQVYRDFIRLNQAFRDSDRDILRPAHWNRDSDSDVQRDYMIDPLGERIPYVWADLLFGEDPLVFAADKADVDRMDELLDYNDASSELHRAEWICSSEGEVWYRIVPNPLMKHADIEWHSRLSVTPLWIGRKLVAAAFVSILDQDEQTIWRYVEVHAEGHVRRLLYKGSAGSDNLGTEQPLTARMETADWERDWMHGLAMLADRVYNRLDSDRKMGTSDYSGLRDLLLALNESTTVGQENMRLTAKQRAIIPQRFLNMAGNFPRGSEILIATEVDQDPEKLKAEVAMVEFSFDAKALILYIDSLTDTILTRARVAPQLVGRHTEGAQTGPALRARLLDSVLAAQGKGKPWDDQGPHIIQKACQVEALPETQGGLGIAWANVKDAPAFKRTSALPEDPESLNRRLAIAVNAEILSRKTAIQEAHPEWDDGRIQDEVDQIMLEVGSGVIPPEGSITNPYRPSRVNPGSHFPNPQDKTTPKPGTALAPSKNAKPDQQERANGPNGRPSSG